MPHNNKRVFLNAAAFGLIVSLASPAFAAIFDYHKVVRDERGQVVHALRSGTCVRTTWVAGSNVCAPVIVEQKVTYIAPPPPPQIVEQRVDVLTADEKTVYFPFDSAQLTPEAQARLDTVAAKLSAARSVKGASIVGFADRIGANNYNQTLSERRAHAVKDYLAGRGYLNTQVARVRGVGEQAPSASCNPRLPRENQISCLAPDRKVQLDVQYTETHLQKTLVQPATYAPPVPGEVIYTQPAVEVEEETQ